jgi:hypothetical protein
MKAKEIQEGLLKGTQYENEASGWYTLSRPKENFFVIQFEEIYKKGQLVQKEEMKFYKNIDSYSKRIAKLIRTGE